MEISTKTFIEYGQLRYEEGKRLGFYRGVAVTLGTVVLLYLGASFAAKIIGHSLHPSKDTAGIGLAVSQQASSELPEPGKLEKII